MVYFANKNIPNTQVFDKNPWIFDKKVLYYTMEDEKFWDRVRRLLRNHKITQKQLADKTHIPLSTLTRWMHFGIIPDTARLYNIAVTLGVTSNILLGGGEKDIEERRIRELAARRALAIVEDLAKKILVEVQEAGPLR